LNPSFAATGFAFTGLIAVMVMGPAGIMTSLLFAPVFLLVTVRSRSFVSHQMALHQSAQRPLIVGWLSKFLGRIGHPTVAMIIEIDDFARLEEVYSADTLATAMSFAQTSIKAHLMENDVTVHLEGGRFGCALALEAPFNLEAMLNTCTRIQHAISNAPATTDLLMPLSASIGLAASDRLERPTGDSLMQAALSAMSDARPSGPNAVRSFSKKMSDKRLATQKAAKDAQRAFEAGEIFAYFQPQVSMDNGTLSGFEALARWHHPERGIVSPAEFLPALERAGLMKKLGDAMVEQAVQALQFWDKSGLEVPCIGVNFSTSELRDPRLVDRLALHLNAGNIAPHRLVIEVLETVIAGEANDDIISNLSALADLGCGIDLDDFGTGYASITNIRRFSIGRIKIDRSFIMGVRTDTEQRDMVAAILTMAERLGVKTLAEGVETRSEHDALKALGCNDAQGFFFARPMPVQETIGWAAAFFSHKERPVQLSKRVG